MARPLALAAAALVAVVSGVDLFSFNAGGGDGGGEAGAGAAGAGGGEWAAPRIRIVAPRFGDVLLGRDVALTVAVGGLGGSPRSLELCVSLVAEEGAGAEPLHAQCSAFAYGGGGGVLTSAPTVLRLEEGVGEGWVRFAVAVREPGAPPGGLFASDEVAVAVVVGRYAARVGRVTKREYGLGLAGFLDAAAACHGGAELGAPDGGAPRVPCDRLPHMRPLGLSWGLGGSGEAGALAAGLAAIARPSVLFLPLAEVDLRDMPPAARLRLVPLLAAGRALAGGGVDGREACPPAPRAVPVPVLHMVGDGDVDEGGRLVWCNRTWGPRGQNAAIVAISRTRLHASAVEALRVRGGGGGGAVALCMHVCAPHATHFLPNATARAQAFDALLARSTWVQVHLAWHGLPRVRTLLVTADAVHFSLYMRPRSRTRPEFGEAPPPPRNVSAVEPDGGVGDGAAAAAAAAAARFVVYSSGALSYGGGQDIVVAAFREFAARHADAHLLAAWSAGGAGSLESLALSPHTSGAPARGAEGTLAGVPEWLEANGVPRARATARVGEARSLRFSPLAASDVGVFAPRADGGEDTAAVEAVACGLPVLLGGWSGATADLLSVCGDDCGALEAGTEHEDVAALPGDAGAVDRRGWFEPDVAGVVAGLERVFAAPAAARARARAAAGELSREWSWLRATSQLADDLQELRVLPRMRPRRPDDEDEDEA